MFLDSTRCLGAGLESGSSDDITICVPPGKYEPFACGGDHDDEVSWTIFYSQDGKSKRLDGGAGSCGDTYGTFNATESFYSVGDDDTGDKDDSADDDDNGSTENVCFAADQLVQTEQGAVEISSVRVGDRVQVMQADGALAYADVAFVPHAENDIASKFIEVHTAQMRSLKVTPQHLVVAGECGAEMSLVTAESLEKGQCVHTVSGAEQIIDLVVVRGRGIYSIVTTDMHGHIVVNGIVASSFGTVHLVPNAYYTIHRMLYMYLLPAWVMELDMSKHLNMFIGGAGITFASPFLLRRAGQ